MLKQYEVYSCGNAGSEIYLKNPDLLKENEERTKEYEGDILLDVILESNEVEAVAKVSEEWEIHPDMLYAVQHIVDAFFSADKDQPRPRIEGSSYTGDDDCGFELLLPDMRTVRIGFKETGRQEGKYLMSVSVKTGDDEKNISKIYI